MRGNQEDAKKIAQAIEFRASADRLKVEAARLERMADRSEALARRATAQRARRATPGMAVFKFIRWRLEDGFTEPDAIRMASLKHDMTYEKVQWIWDNAKAHDKRLKRFLRNMEIMRLARAGYQNGEIAERVGLHVGSISRIIQREIRNSRQWSISGPMDPEKPWRLK